MNINLKKFEEINEEDLLEVEKSPIFEDLKVEFKYQYDGNADELRKDVIQFANSNKGGIIFYGVSEDPLKFVGLEYDNVDKIKIHLNNILPRKIDPVLSPFPKFKIVELKNGKFVLCLKIFPKEDGIYGIRLSDNPSNSKFKVYEFYSRLDGTKHQMKIEEVVNLIETKSKGSKKMLEVKIHPTVSTEVDNFNEVYLSLTAVNKGTRPIIVTSYGFYIIKHDYQVTIISNNPLNRYLCDSLPKKLLDGEACSALYPRKVFEMHMKENNLKYPLEVKAFVNTNDGKFFSNPIELIKSNI